MRVIAQQSRYACFANFSELFRSEPNLSRIFKPKSITHSCSVKLFSKNAEKSWAGECPWYEFLQRTSYSEFHIIRRFIERSQLFNILKSKAELWLHIDKPPVKGILTLKLITSRKSWNERALASPQKDL